MLFNFRSRITIDIWTGTGLEKKIDTNITNDKIIKDNTNFLLGLWIPKSHDLTIELDQKFRRLAEEVEKNAETFCQIEFMVRKIPVDEVRDYDIKLIVQNLLLGCRARWVRRIGKINLNGLVFYLMYHYFDILIIMIRKLTNIK